jgi:hypothetical protein
LSRKIVHKNTLANEKKQKVENRIFDPHITEKAIISCLTHKIKPNTDVLLLLSPLIRNILTTFFLFYDCFTKDYQYQISTVVDRDLKENFFRPFDLLENYNFSFEQQIKDIEKNIICNESLLRRVGLERGEIAERFKIFVDLLRLHKPINYEETILFTNEVNQEIDKTDKGVKCIRKIKKIILNFETFGKVFCISHWGVMNSLFRVKKICNLEMIKFNLI